MPQGLLMRAWRSGRRAQAAVLMALSIFAMVLLLAMATNIGVVVNDKIRMQTTADAATYAVAYSEAASLNELVQLNKGIVEAVKQCRQVLSASPWPETVLCGCQADSQLAELAVTACKARIDIAISRFVARAPYNRTVGTAISAGEATAQANFANSRVSFFQDFPGSPTFRSTHTLVASLNSSPGSITIPSIADFRQVSDTALNYSVFVTCPMPPAGECLPVPPMLGPTTSVNSWFYKQTRDPDVWVAGRVSGTPEYQFLDTAYGIGGNDGGFFGASSTGGDDEIYAYAVAKPYDGSMGPSGLSGNQRNGNARGLLGVYSARGTEYPKLSMYDQYRARMAGVNENLEGSVSPRDLVQLDGLRNRKQWDMDKVKH